MTVEQLKAYISSMDEMKSNIEAYQAMQQELEDKHMGKWVLFHSNALIAVYDSFEKTAEDAVKRFGRGPYLIRQIGAPSVTLPASVMFRPVYG